MRRLSAENVVAPPFRSLAEAQCAHVELVAQAQAVEERFANALPGDNREAAVALARLRRQIRAFEWRMAASGARMPDGSQRSFAQSLLDFWAVRQADLRATSGRFRTRTWKDARPVAAAPVAARLLLPYDPATAAEAAAEAEAIYLAMPDDAARENAKAALVSMALEGTGGAELVPALAPFIAAGIVAQQVADPSGPPLTIAHEALPTAWERFAGWLDEARQKQADLERVLNEAEAWVQTGSAAELPRGAAIDRAAQYSQEDDAISNYVRAALKRRTVERAVLVAVVAAFLGLVLLAGWKSIANWMNESALVQLQVEDKIAQAETVDPVTAPAGGQADSIGGATGWIWLGSADAPQVVGEDGRKLDLTTIGEGTEVRTMANLKVRERQPDNDGKNIAGARSGAVAAGSTAVALEPSVSVDVDGTRQYWLKVRLVPVVFIQLDQNAGFSAGPLRERLTRAGFSAPAEQRLPNIARPDASPAFDVRYYFKQDEPDARRVARLVADSLSQGAPERVAVPQPISLTGTPLAERVKPGTIEVWLFHP